MEENPTDGETLANLSIEVRDLIDKISKLFDKNERDLFRSHGVQGLTPPQLFLLRHLWMQEGNKGYTCKKLADLSHVSRATITGIVDTMEKEEYVVRKTNPKDRRSIIIKLTENGRELKRYKPPIDSIKINYLQDFSPKELELLVKLLKKLYRAISINNKT